MRTKAFGEDNIIHLGTYYQSEELGEEKKLEMEEYLKNLDSKKFKEFMEWKEEMERKKWSVSFLLFERFYLEDKILHYIGR